MLQYTSNAQELKPLFYSSYNNIDVYVEDDNDESFYEILLNKIVDSSIRIKRVFGLGGKPRLLEKAKEQLSNPSHRKAFFIADGDFDRILNRNVPDIEVLYILKEYCIENFLFEEQAICNVIQEERPRRKIRNIKANIKVYKWLEETVNSLTPLFACFIAIQKHSIGIPNVKIGIGQFISNKGIPKLDSNKVEAYVNELKKNHNMLGTIKFDEEIENITKKMGSRWQTRKRYVCGRKYLLPLLRFEIKSRFRRDLNPGSLRFRIMNHCKLQSLRELATKIEIVCRN